MTVWPYGWQPCKDNILDAELIQKFKTTINESDLKWTIALLDNHVVFMDLNIFLKKGQFSRSILKTPWLATSTYLHTHVTLLAALELY